MLEKYRQAVRGRRQVVFARITNVSHGPRSASVPAIRYYYFCFDEYRTLYWFLISYKKYIYIIQ